MFTGNKMSDIDNAAVSSMPYITMQKTSGILPHCMNVCTILEKELTKREIEELQEKAQQRGKLIQKLAERNLLHSTLLGDPESLPVFIFLMKQLTKKEYLAAVAKNKYPTCRTIYKTIMKASVKNDLETAKIVESYSTGECTGSELRDQLNKICNCKDMSSESENRPVADVISVGTLDRVPDGSNFVCFQSVRMAQLEALKLTQISYAVTRHYSKEEFELCCFQAFSACRETSVHFSRRLHNWNCCRNSLCRKSGCRPLYLLWTPCCS